MLPVCIPIRIRTASRTVYFAWGKRISKTQQLRVRLWLDTIFQSEKLYSLQNWLTFSRGLICVFLPDLRVALPNGWHKYCLFKWETHFSVIWFDLPYQVDDHELQSTLKCFYVKWRFDSTNSQDLGIIVYVPINYHDAGFPFFCICGWVALMLVVTSCRFRLFGLKQNSNPNITVQTVFINFIGWYIQKYYLLPCSFINCSS